MVQSLVAVRGNSMVDWMGAKWDFVVAALLDENMAVCWERQMEIVLVEKLAEVKEFSSVGEWDTLMALRRVAAKGK